jgi:16S rRNA (cytosine1402-N4)-methyltransferase
MTNYPHSYHLPVLLPDVIKFLITDPEGIYLDGTLGGGGHAEEILKVLKEKSLYIGVDQDLEAIQYAESRLNKYPNIRIHQSNFAEFGNVLDKLDLKEIDGILLDLGVSSHQIDAAERGFSYMQDAPLDMRMDQESQKTAGYLLNNLDEKELSNIFFLFGEERKSRQIARKIVDYRQSTPIDRSEQLKQIIDRVIPGRFAVKSYARIFQALRIAVNQELQFLEEALQAIVNYLKTGGRCVIISYHSLEDRIVKNFLRKKANPCTCPPDFPICVCGLEPEFKILTSRAVMASEMEIRNNPRSRSARLRVGEKL